MGADGVRAERAAATSTLTAGSAVELPGVMSGFVPQTSAAPFGAHPVGWLASNDSPLPPAME